MGISLDCEERNIPDLLSFFFFFFFSLFPPIHYALVYFAWSNEKRFKESPSVTGVLPDTGYAYTL